MRNNISVPVFALKVGLRERADCFAYFVFWCLVMVERLFLTVPWGCLQFVIVVFPDHTHLLFLISFSIQVPKWVSHV